MDKQKEPQPNQDEASDAFVRDLCRGMEDAARVLESGDPIALDRVSASTEDKSPAVLEGREVLFRWTPPEDMQKLHRIWSVADEYAIVRDPECLDGGILLYGKYGGQWVMNPSSRPVIAELLGQFGRLQGTHDHPEHYCHRCGGRNITWYVDSDLWNQVMRKPNASGQTHEDAFRGILCPICFVELADIAGVLPTAWRISQEGDDPEVNKLRVTCHEAQEQVDALKAELGVARMGCTAMVCGNCALFQKPCNWDSETDRTRQASDRPCEKFTPKPGLATDRQARPVVTAGAMRLREIAEETWEESCGAKRHLLEMADSFDELCAGNDRLRATAAEEPADGECDYCEVCGSKMPKEAKP